MPAWNDAVFLIPIAGVLLAWATSNFAYEWTIRCASPRLACGNGGSLGALTTALSQLDLRADPDIQQAYDVAARFAWHPTLVAFIVTALAMMFVCWYLIYGSLSDSAKTKDPWAWITGLSALLIIFATVSWQSPEWNLRADVLAPLMMAALGRNAAVDAMAAQSQQVFRTLAFTSSSFVVLAAAASLLTPRKLLEDGLEVADPPPPANSPPGLDLPSGSPPGDGAAGAAGDPATVESEELREVTRHLADQWRRLTFTLYAGAALLVTAVVHQSSMYGWGTAFANAMKDSREARATIRIDSLRAAKSRLARAELRYARDSLPTSAAAAAARNQLLRDSVSAARAVADPLTQRVALDSVANGASVRRVTSMMARVNELTAAAITRGGGIVYTILLAMTYLPAALILMERSWELSYRVKDGPQDNADTRAEWRKQHGIAFSFSTQWSKVFAVLSPLIASGGSLLLLKLFE